MKETGLEHHYRVLKQFLDISEDLNYRVKPLSTRAQRAREKLLKLSEAQFKELSTDVYDELRRRIDESRSEPDFLLPKLTFHPKRNQARQKLSALPQARFKDLVCDIAFEIERRKLNVSSTTTNHARGPSESSTIRKLAVGETPQPFSGSSHRHTESASGIHVNTNVNSHVNTNAPPAATAAAAAVGATAVAGGFYDGVIHSPTETTRTTSSNGGYPAATAIDHVVGANDLADMSHSTTATHEPATGVADMSGIEKNSINVLSKTVVPVKANLAWSSDEEDEVDEPLLARSDLLPDKEVHKEAQGIDYSVFKNDFEDLNEDADNGFGHGNNFNRQLEEAINPRSVSLKDDKYRGDEEEVPVQRGIFGIPMAAPVPVPSAKHTDHEEEVVKLRNKLLALESDYTELEEKYKASQLDSENHKIDNENLSHEVSQLRKALSQNKEEASKSLDLEETPEYKELASNFALLKTTNAALNLELQSLKAEHKHLESRAKDRAIDVPELRKGDSSDVNIKQAQGDWSNFLEKLEEIDAPKKSSHDKSLKNGDLQQQVIDWQHKYEQARANQIATKISDKMLDQNAMKSLVSPSGLISIKLVSELQSLIESYLLYISEDLFDPEILFDKISRMSILANEIAIQGDNYKAHSNEYSVLLRESTSYALTATRYLVSHQLFLPKIIVERAVSEIGFALCDLSTSCKLNEKSALAREISIQRHNPVRNVVDEEFGVRPLRMTNKLRSSALTNPAINAPEELRSNRSFSQDDNAPIVSQQLNAYKATPKQIRLGQVPVVVSNNNKPLNEEPDSHDSRRETVSTFESASDYEADVFIGQRSPVIAKVHNGVSDFSPFKEDGIVNALTSTINIVKSPQHRDQKVEMLKEEPSPFNDGGSSKANVILSTGLGIDDKKDSIGENNSISARSSPETKKSSLAQKLQKFAESKDDVREVLETPKKTPQSSKISSLANRFENTRTPEDNSPLKSANGLPSNKVSPAIAKLTSKFNGMGDTLPASSSLSSGGRKDSESFLDRVKKFEVTPPQLEKKNSQDSLKTSDTGSPSKDRGIASPEEAAESPVNRGKSFLGKLRDRLTGDSPVKNASEPSDEKTEKPDEDSSELSAERSSLNSISVKETSTDDTDASSRSIKKFDVESVADSEATLGPMDTSSSGGKLVSFSKTPVGVSSTPSALHSSLNRNGSKSGKKVNIVDDPVIVAPAAHEYDSEYDTESQDNYADAESVTTQNREEAEARQRQEYRKSMAAATFNIKLFDINDPDNTVTQVLLYLEHQTVKVISTIQSLLSAIKKQGVTRGELSTNAQAITIVITQMTEATNTSMNQTRNYQLKEHGNWVVKSLEDCCQRMNALTQAHSHSQGDDGDFADKNFKQRLAGISFDIAKCTKELVKSVEEASLKEEIDQLNAKLSTSPGDDW